MAVAEWEGEGEFEPEKEALRENWNKLHDEGLCDLYSEPVICRESEFNGTCGAGENAQCDLVGNNLGRPRHKYKHNFKLDVR